MSQETTTVGTSWVKILDLAGKWIQCMTISRESEVELQISFDAGSTIEFRVTQSFLALETRRIPTGGAVYARVTEETAEVIVNYD